MAAVTHQAAAFAVCAVVDFADAGQGPAADVRAVFPALDRAKLIVHRDAPKHRIARQHRRRSAVFQIAIQPVVHF
jgi:hypothetical protein